MLRFAWLVCAVAAEINTNQPFTAAAANHAVAANRTRVMDEALLLAGLDWAGARPENVTAATVSKHHPLLVALRRTRALVHRVPRLYRWLTRLVNPRPVEPPPPPPPAPVAGPAATPQIYDAGAALDAYARSCARYAVAANGAVLGALRFGGVCVKPSDASGGAPFGDADLLAVVDAICDPASVARALDLTRVDGARFTAACAARALSHALAKADRGRGLSYLALVNTPLGPRGASKLASAATARLRAIRLSGCDLRDAGLDAFATALETQLPLLERLDVARNRASRHACRRLTKAAKRRGVTGLKCRVEQRGNCLALEACCAATHVLGVAAFGIGGPYLLHEAKRLGLDGACVRSLAVYACAHVVYFAASAQTHLAEVCYGRSTSSQLGAPRPPPRSRWDAAAPALVLAATHYPFAAFLQLDAATSRRVQGSALVLCAVALYCHPPGSDRDPPSLRVGKYAPVETLSLLFVGSFAASATALPLRRALGDAAFRSLAAGALLHVAGSICHVAAGAGHAAAHALTLTGATLNAMVVLKSLVWHFLPAAPAPRPPGTSPPA